MADPNIQELKFSVTDPTFGTTLGIPIVRNWRLDVKKTGSDAGSYVLYDTSFGSGNPPILRSDKVQSGTDANGNPQYVWKTSVVDSYKSTYDRLEENQKRFLFDTMTKNSDKKRADFINDSYTQTQRNDLFRDIPGVKNVATTPDGRVIPPGTSPTGLANIPPAEASESSPTSTRQNGERTQETITSEDLSISRIQADDSGKKKWWYGIDRLIYPTDI